MRTYEAPELFVDEYVADTMIASSGTKMNNPDNNQNCWFCRYTFSATDPEDTDNSCLYLPGTDAYKEWC